MSIEDIIRVWKDGNEAANPAMPENPVGDELSDQEVRLASGGMPCTPGLTCVTDITEICSEVASI